MRPDGKSSCDCAIPCAIAKGVISAQVASAPYTHENCCRRTFCGGTIARRWCFCAAAVRLIRQSQPGASKRDYPSEMTSVSSTPGSSRLRVDCKQAHREAQTGSVSTGSILATKIAITSQQADVHAVQPGTKRDLSYQYGQVSYHSELVGQMAKMMKITYLQQFDRTLRALARAKLMISVLCPASAAQKKTNI